MKGKDEILNQIKITINFLESAREERKKALDDLLYGYKVARVEELDDAKAFSLGLELEYQIEELDDAIDDLERQSRYIFRFKEI